MLKKEETILRQILWGERPINHLHFAKVKVFKEAGQYRIENTRHLSINAEVYDVARGIRTHQAELPKLKEWAHFILNTDELFGLNLHKDETGKMFLQAMKDLAEGKPLESDVLQTALEIVPELPEKKFLGE